MRLEGVNLDYNIVKLFGTSLLSSSIYRGLQNAIDTSEDLAALSLLTLHC